MKISENGLALIKMFEGLELDSYQDIAGVWTIGYGHTETAGPNQKISAREAEDLLRRDLGPREQAVNQFVKVSLNQNEFDALISLVFNIGAGAFKKSTALGRLNRGDRMGAAEALTWFNKANIGGVLREVVGLARRRAAERALFLTPVNPPIVNRPDAENSRATPVEEAPRRENLGESRTVQGATVAGGAGAAASTIGKDSATELVEVETNIQNGTGLTEKPPDQGGLGAGAANEGPTSGGGATTDGSTAPGATTDGSAADGGTGNGSSDDGTTSGATGGATTGGDATTGTTQTIETSSERPSKHEKHAVDAQLQFALLVIIILSALYVVFARVDDWFRYRR